MKTKYKILEDHYKTLEDGTVVYRIQALKDFGVVKKGDIGGWIQQESNLSHYRNCWVYDDAVVQDNAVVRNYAIVRDNAIVRDYVMIRDNAVVRDDAVVCDNAIIRDNDIVTKDTLYLYNVYKLTLTDNYIYYGCIKKLYRNGETG